MKIYGLIPARSGSKGVPDKNIKLLKGYPLLAYSIIASKLCHNINKTYVSTDSYEYAQIADKFNIDDCIRRPEYLCKDNSTDLDYLLHFIYVENIKPEDIIVLLRPTTPLRDIDILEKTIECFINSNTPRTSLRSVHKLNESPEKMFKPIPCKKGDQLYIESYMNIDSETADLPRQHFDICYQPNGYIDILTVKNILINKDTYGDNIMGLETKRVTEIDSIDDFEYLEYEINKNDNKLYTYIKEHYEPETNN